MAFFACAYVYPATTISIIAITTTTTFVGCYCILCYVTFCWKEEFFMMMSLVLTVFTTTTKTQRLSSWTWSGNRFFLPWSFCVTAWETEKVSVFAKHTIISLDLRRSLWIWFFGHFYALWMYVFLCEFSCVCKRKLKSLRKRESLSLFLVENKSSQKKNVNLKL